MHDIRAKGVCFMNENIGLLLAGQLEKDFRADFISLEAIVKYQMKLKTIYLNNGKYLGSFPSIF